MENQAMDIRGKTVIITGGNSGIGLEAAVKLARLGAEIVLVARHEGKLASAVAEVKARAGSPRISSIICDFASQAAIRGAAETFRKTHTRLDILINNAGSVSARRRVTPDGLEETFAVNHLGYFLLTNLLCDFLERSAPARVVNVASNGHRHGDLDFDDLQMEEGYAILRAYGRSKLGNILFTRELARRLDPGKVTANCLHPGDIATNIWSHAPGWARPLLAVLKLFLATAEQGADRIVFLAANEAIAGKTGGYYVRDALVEPSALARDEGAAKQLWDISAQLTGLAP